MSKRALQQRLMSLEQAGVTSLPRRRGHLNADAAMAQGTQPAAAAATPASDRASALAIIRDEVAACQRCGELAAGRTQTVFGAGPPAPRLCFFGEAPGADEDASGVPFVGAAGQLLTKMIGAMGFSRDAGPDTGQTDGFLLSARSRLVPRTFRCAPSFVAATPRSTVRRK